MNKLLQILKDNIAFAIMIVFCLAFWIIGIAGEYETVIHNFKTDHYTFFNGAETGVPLAILYAILPIVFIVGAVVLKVFVPKNRMKVSATVVAGLFLLIAIAACVLLVLLLIAIPDEAHPSFTQVGDAYNNMYDPYFSKVFNLPFLGMTLSLVGLIITGAYGAATCSE